MKLQNSLLTTIKKSGLLLVIASLLACQAETSAQNDAAEQATDAIESVKTKVEEGKATVGDYKATVSDAKPTAAQAPTVDDAKEVMQETVNETAPQAAPVTIATGQTTLSDSQYSPVREQMVVSTGDKIEVAELFWFGCGHCFALEPKIKAWKDSKPANAEFVKVPALFSRRWEFHGQAYYTMEALGVEQEAYDKFFRRIHVERRGINSLNQLVDFLANYGKTKEQVESTFNSFAVDTKMRNARKITNASGATGVPAMIVDGKYITNQTKAGSVDEMFNVVNQLVDKAAAER